MARRGFLRGFLALAPAAALATTAALPAAAAPPQRENWKLLRLGEQLAAIDAAFAAAIGRKAVARAAADRLWPVPPAEIVFAPGVRAPLWCGVDQERDIDDKPIVCSRSGRTRRIACRWQLETFVTLAGRKGASSTDRATAIEARELLRTAITYEEAREAVIEQTGYVEARDELYAVSARLDRVAELIYKCEAQTFVGLSIKARALIVASKACEVDHYIAHRSKVLYAEKLASSILRLQTVGAGQ